ncbi:MAG: isopenicillin N synthase family dioxygenase [Rhodospirillales bacterium]|jgi:isopenicillin N synthase-like dioxygenase
MNKNSTDQIPIIDIGPFLSGDLESAQETAKELCWVQEEIGFYYIINHGVSKSLIQSAVDQVKNLHSLSMEEKLKLKVDEDTTGYVPIKSTIYVTSNAGDNNKFDLNENFRIVRERPLNHPSIKARRRFTGPNKWPSNDLLPNFKKVMLEYYSEMENLGRCLLPLYARALDLKPDYFDDMFTDPTWFTRNVHYPAIKAEENQFGISPHSDHGFITLLPISEVPGLEVKTQAGNWMKGDYIEGAMIVNSGDFMQKWTNGRFIATPHRVIAPKQERYVSAFFYNPNWDVCSDPLPTCISSKHPARFAVATFHEHLCNYVDRNYTKSTGGQAPNMVLEREKI